MSRSPLLLLLACAPALVGCGEAEVLGDGTVAVASLRGAPIDGTADEGYQPPAEVANVSSASEDSATDAGDAAAESPTDESGDAEGTAAGEDDVFDFADLEPLEDDEEGDSEGGEGEEPRRPEPDEDGVYHLVFSDLSLEGEDIDNIIDYLLFPEEFEEGEGFQFPDHLKALDGKPITISGYMIPGRIRKNKVRDFMLVRDLAGCCFGGAPNPDEWIDVVMVDDAEAEYLRYLPITVHGTLSLIGEQDQEGYAVGVYRMKATWAGEKD